MIKRSLVNNGDYIRSAVELLVVFSFFNDNLIVDVFKSSFLLKGAIGLFIITFWKELFIAARSNYGKRILLFVAILCLTIIYNINDYTIGSIFGSLSLIVAIISITLVFYKISSVKTLTFIWFSVLISIIYSIFKDPLSEYTFRRGGGTGDPNEFASHVIVFLLIGLGLYSLRKYKSVLVITIPFFVIGILNAGSVSSLIVSSIIIAIITGVTIKKNPKSIFLVFVSIITIGFSYNYILTIEDVQNVVDRASSNEGNADARFKAWNAAVGMFEHNPILGTGVGNFVKRASEYSHTRLEEGGETAHNMFLLMIGEGGAIAGLLFIYLLYKSINKNDVFSSGNPTYFYIFLSFLGLTLMGMTLSMTYDKYFWLLFAIQNKSVASLK
ncbi:O-antigen ligase family protein [Pontibacter populi]|uniref:O-antigen ligase family protein n=1 Tax=Pontibacter populi TaxID=890055 RepID=A0ABV1RVW9_9BACT